MEIGITGRFKRDALDSNYEDNLVSDYESPDEAEPKTYSNLDQAVIVTYIAFIILYVVFPTIIILLRCYVFVNIPKLDLLLLFSFVASL